MNELRISEHTKLTGGDDFNAMADRAASVVWIWDCGPPQPKAPVRPKPPKGVEGEPEYDLGMIEFREAIGDYETALKAYRVLKTEYADWQKKYGGPYEFYQWSVDARDTFDADTRAVAESRQDELRYYLSARTRGYGNGKIVRKATAHEVGIQANGLPEGVRPGKGHAENLKRELESNADLAAAQRRDPVFGDQELRP